MEIANKASQILIDPDLPSLGEATVVVTTHQHNEAIRVNRPKMSCRLKACFWFLEAEILTLYPSPESVISTDIMVVILECNWDLGSSTVVVGSGLLLGSSGVSGDA
jgi:hypothetical protein